MVFASVGPVAIGAGVLCITVSGLLMASQVFWVPKASIAFGTLVLVGFGFVVCDFVVAVDRSVSNDRMEMTGSNIPESRLGFAIFLTIAARKGGLLDHGRQDICQVL
jgi:hypothetical protein